MNHRSEWKPNFWGMFLAVTCQHASGACQSHSRLVLSLREASRKYVELFPSTPPFMTLQFHKKDLRPTPNLLRIRHTTSTWAYSFSQRDQEGPLALGWGPSKSFWSRKDCHRKRSSLGLPRLFQSLWDLHWRFKETAGSSNYSKEQANCIL